MKYELISDFTHADFQIMFRAYFEELGIPVQNWEGLFAEMDGGGNEAYLAPDGGEYAGFIQFCPMELTSWFFVCRIGLIREFWVRPERRNRGAGTELLRLAEARLAEGGAGAVLLTTDTAERFYLARGYAKAPWATAQNGDDVYFKVL